MSYSFDPYGPADYSWSGHVDPAVVLSGYHAGKGVGSRRVSRRWGSIAAAGVGMGFQKPVISKRRTSVMHSERYPLRR